MNTPNFGLTILALPITLAGPISAGGQTTSSEASPAQRLFESGQYDQTVQAIAEARGREATGPQETFLAAHAYLRLNQNDLAKTEFGRLTESSDERWRLVGESSAALVDNNLDRSLELATQAASMTPGGPDVRDFAVLYQLGLVKMRREDWAGSAEAFERAAQSNPAFAYAHYYAGLAYSRIQRLDRVAAHFEQFLKLAPDAPERSAVMSIMRTLRGV